MDGSEQRSVLLSEAVRVLVKVQMRVFVRVHRWYQTNLTGG